MLSICYHRESVKPLQSYYRPSAIMAAAAFALIPLILAFAIVDAASKPDKGADMVVPGKKGIGGSAKGCPWFFDPDGTVTGLVGPKDCACCPKKYLPCGYPKHRRCYKASDYKDGERGGCSGVKPYGGWTLSTIGGVCHYNLSDFTCAICSASMYNVYLYTWACFSALGPLDYRHRF